MVLRVTEHLLENEIARLSQTDNLAEHEQFMLHQCQKELAVLNRLRIEGIDLTGSIEEVEIRLKGNSIYFVDKVEYECMQHKAALLDIVKQIVS